MKTTWFFIFIKIWIRSQTKRSKKDPSGPGEERYREVFEFQRMEPKRNAFIVLLGNLVTVYITSDIKLLTWMKHGLCRGGEREKMLKTHQACTISRKSRRIEWIFQNAVTPTISEELFASITKNDDLGGRDCIKAHLRIHQWQIPLPLMVQTRTFAPIQTHPHLFHCVRLYKVSFCDLCQRSIGVC